MLTPDLEAAITQCVEDAKRVMLECIKDETSLPPAMMVYVSGAISIIDTTPFMTNGMTKDLLAMMMKRALAKPEVDMVMLCAEAWMLKQKLTDPDPTEGISNHPDRTEALIINVMTKDDNFFFGFPVDRENGTLGEQIGGPDAKVHGRFTHNPSGTKH